MALVPAYDRRTHRKLPHYVPEAWFGHPVLGENLRPTPMGAAARKKKNPDPPADGDNPDKEK